MYDRFGVGVLWECKQRSRSICRALNHPVRAQFFAPKLPAPPPSLPEPTKVYYFVGSYSKA